MSDGKLCEELIDNAYRDEMTAIFRNFINSYVDGASAEFVTNKCKQDLVKLKWAHAELVRIAKE